MSLRNRDRGLCLWAPWWALLLVVNACGGDDEGDVPDAGAQLCELGEARCEGDTARNCKSPCEDDPECGTFWEDEACANDETCTVTPNGGAFCSLSDGPEPRCASRTAYCDDDALINCRDEYPDTRYDCTQEDLTCAEAADGAAICALSTAPDPRCTEDGVSLQTVCDGNTLVECFLDFATSETECASCVTPGVNLAMCQD